MRRRFVLTITISLLFSLLFTTNIFAEWVTENNKYKYLDQSTGQYIKNNWLQEGNTFYYLDVNGDIVTGWYLINGKYYYFGDNGVMRVGFVTVNDKTYYLDVTNGQMVTGWIQVYNNGVNDYYYFADDGVMCVGWRNIGNNRFYFYDGKCIFNRFAQINGVWYHFGVNGAMETGWVNANGKMYHFNSTTGAQTRGWVQDEQGNEYYLSPVDGSLTTNITLQIGMGSYTFDSLGRCVSKDVTNGATNQAEITEGVNVGASPGYGTAGMSSYDYDYINSQGLIVGSTDGPK